MTQAVVRFSMPAADGKVILIRFGDSFRCLFGTGAPNMLRTVIAFGLLFRQSVDERTVESLASKWVLLVKMLSLELRMSASVQENAGFKLNNFE